MIIRDQLVTALSNHSYAGMMNDMKNCFEMSKGTHLSAPVSPKGLQK